MNKEAYKLMRKQFEECFSYPDDDNYNDYQFAKFNDGSYQRDNVENMWEGWQTCYKFLKENI